MSRWFWGLLALSAVIVAVVLAIARPGGSGDQESFAHFITQTPTPVVTGDPTIAPLPGQFHVEIDKIKDGDDWCDPVDTEDEVDIDEVYEIAVCMTSPSDSTSAFSLQVTYDDTLNECQDEVCAETGGTNCRDDNPDANVGDTLGSGVPTDPDLGSGWDCSGFGLIEPECDIDPGSGPGLGIATLDCLSMIGPYTSPVGDSVSFPLGVVTFKAIGTGVDQMDLAGVNIGDTLGVEMGSCNPSIGVPVPCFGAMDFKDMTRTPAPSPTPTETLTPTITPTASNTPTPTNTFTPTATFTATATPAPSADIDKIQDGATWCDPVDAASTETIGEDHQLAVCVHDVTEPVFAFELVLSYDSELDECLDETCTDGLCLDDNPDVNAGSTTWGEPLGNEWDCDISVQPACSWGMPTTNGTTGYAYMNCSSSDTGLGDPEGDSGVLAVLNLSVLAAGTDTVSIHGLELKDAAGAPIGYCGVLSPSQGIAIECRDAVDTKKPGGTPPHRPTKTPTEEPTATPTEVVPTQPPPPTATMPPPPPPATPTPFGGVGPEVIAPPTGSGPAGGGFPWTLTAWLLAGTAGVAAAAGGFYLRFARGWRRDGSR